VLSRPGLLQALHGQRAAAAICELTSLTKTLMSHKDMTATSILGTESSREPDRRGAPAWRQAIPHPVDGVQIRLRRPAAGC
jgi:hypothetical protein